jgi:hypothetical protein
MTATTELVVPRSIPIILLILVIPFGGNSFRAYSFRNPSTSLAAWEPINPGRSRSMACSLVQFERQYIT